MADVPVPSLVPVSPFPPTPAKALLVQSKGNGTQCHIQSQNPVSLLPSCFSQFLSSTAEWAECAVGQAGRDIPWVIPTGLCIPCPWLVLDALHLLLRAGAWQQEWDAGF